MTVYFNELFYVLDADPCEVDPDIRCGCLYVRKFPAECFILGLLSLFVLNKSSHPVGFSRVLL